ncbi:MAG TPA: DUF4271 domain-containing protein [Cytophagales bacterium]|nr:DUF4271 domain-containing protein [Cytophagales bacterium]
MRFISILLISFISLNGLVAQESEDFNQFRVVKDLRSELLVYDPDFSSYVPYNSEIHSGTNFITIQLDSSLNKKYSCILYISKGSSLFFDNKLYEKSDKEGWIQLKSREINNSKWLTIFHPSGKLPFNKIFYGLKINSKAPPKLLENKLEARPVFSITFQNFFIIVFIIILILLAVLKVFNNKAYNEFYSIRRNTLAIGKDQSFIFKKPLNRNNIASLFIHCLIFVFVFFIIQFFTDGLIQLSLFNRQNSLSQLLLSYFTFVGIAFGVYILKFILIAFISYLYNVTEYKLVHYFNFIKLSMVFYLLILPFISIIYLWFDRLNERLIINVIFLCLIGFSIAKIIVISYNLNKIRQFRNLYLFSYLCATEIIPLFIVFKLLV